MDFKFLEETQPKFIKLINNSIKKDRLAQVYLFDGVKGTPKMQGAMYLASRILCENGNNCGECKSCLMLSNGVHPDLITISPTRAEGVVSDGTIKKEQIEDLIHEFSLASPNKRVFIINEIEKTTLSSANTLLKFLEEMKNNTYGILCTDNLSAVLSTIKSRSQIVTFEKINKDTLFSFYESKSIDKELARVLCTLTNNVNEGLELSKNETILGIIDLVKKINKGLLTNESPIVIMNDDGKFLLSNPDKRFHQIFLDLLIRITNDRLFYMLGKSDEMVFLETIEELDEYGVDVRAINYNDTFKMEEIMIDYKQRLNYNVNLELLYMDLFIKCEVKTNE